MSDDITIKVPAEDRERAAKRLHDFILSCLPGKALLVTIERLKRERSGQQNRYLFGVAYPPIMEHQGLAGEDEKQELHEVFCGLHFGWVEYEVLGVRKKKPRRTTTRNEHGKRDVLSTVDFMGFSDDVIRRASIIGVYVPAPNEYIDPETGEVSKW